MGQYYDFGSQVGPLLSQALDREQRKKEFTAQEARMVIEQENIQRRHEQQLAEQGRQADLLNARATEQNRDVVINQVRDDFIEETQLPAILGKDYASRLKGVKKFTGAEISSIYGKGYGNVIAPGNYYDAKIIGVIKEDQRLAQERARIEANLPQNMPGADELPLQKVKGMNQQIQLPLELPAKEAVSGGGWGMGTVGGIGPGGFGGKPAVGPAKAWTSDEVKEFVAKKYPSAQLPQNAQFEYDPAKKTVLVTPLDESGLPAAENYRTAYDQPDIDKFFSQEGGLNKMKKFIEHAKSTTLTVNNESIVDVGGEVYRMIQQSPKPEYIKKARFLMPYVEAWIKKENDRMEKQQMTKQLQQARLEQQALLKLAYSADTPPEIRLRAQERVASSVGLGPGQQQQQP